MKWGLILPFGKGALVPSQGIANLLMHLLIHNAFGSKVVIASTKENYEDIEKLIVDSRLSLDQFLFLDNKKRVSFCFNFRFVGQVCVAIGFLLNKMNSKVFLLLKTNLFLTGFFWILAKPVLFLFFVMRLQKLVAFFKCNLVRRFVSFLKKNVRRQIISFRRQILLFTHVDRVMRSFFVTAVHKHNVKKLIIKINMQSDVSVWYIPAGFWPEFNQVCAKKIIAIPDFVIADFPFLFKKELWGNTFYNMKQVANDTGAHFLCYSEFVKNNHLVQHLHIPRESISVIRHGVTDLLPYLNNNSPREHSLNAFYILKSYQNRENHPYFSDIHFPSIKFIFYSSQIRPHKNHLNLIKSYELLLRKRFVNCKLIITGFPERDSVIYDYILSNGLERDVLVCHHVPMEVLAALNYCAILAVNPTLFEGGFPFTFCEAFSVGTPSVMSRIPVVFEEFQDEHISERMLFDPYDIEDMADKIEWGINHRSELLMLETPLYTKLAERSWDVVAQEYQSLFRDIAERGTTLKKKFSVSPIEALKKVRQGVPECP